MGAKCAADCMLAEECSNSAEHLRSRLAELSQALSTEAEAVVRQHPTEATDRDATRAHYQHLLRTVYLVDLLRALVLVCDPRTSNVRQALDCQLDEIPNVAVSYSLFHLIDAVEEHEAVCQAGDML